MAFECDLGGWKLSFETGGKLRQLITPGGMPLLYETDFTWELGHGRAFRPCGWDECFPSIEPFGGTPVMGDLIGRAPSVESQAGGLQQSWTLPDYSARRRFTSESGGLTVAFSVTNLAAQRLQFLWASHAIFSTDGLAEAAFSGHRTGSGTPPLSLSDFTVNGTSSKFFVRADQPAVLRRKDLEITLRTDQPYWGIWRQRGGWPAQRPAGFACLGVEATNHDSDFPGSARLDPGRVFHGFVSIEVH